MSHYAKEVAKPIGTAVNGSLPPVSVNAAASGNPANGSWILGSALLAKGRGFAFFPQTGAFTGTTPSCAFSFNVGDDANGTNGAAVTGVDTVTIATANTVGSGVDIPASAIVATKYYGCSVAVTGGTSALVASQLRIMDPIWTD
jgi:hypothetical protein